MSQYLSERWKELTPYVPGEQPQNQTFIKLNTNELPYPPSPAVRRSITEGEIDNLRLYPEPDGNIFRQSLADYYGISREQVYVGNGSDEVLAFAFMAFLDRVQYADITYGFYPVYSGLFKCEAKEIPLRKDFSLNLDDYDAVTPIILANPNAPTGIALSPDVIEKKLLENTERIIIVDEAYVAFGAESVLPLIKKHDNLLVIGTTSKSWGLAGLRAGMAFGSPALIQDLNLIKYSFNSYNLNRLTNVLAAAAVDDKEYEEDVCQKIISTRTRISKELTELGFLQTDSKANFLFVKHEKIRGKIFLQKLREKGILVRHFDRPKIDEYLRVSIGRDREMDQFLLAVKEILLEEQNA